MIDALLLDLDDTLYPQSAFLSAAWDAVAEAGGACGVDAAALRRALDEIAAQGSDQGRIIDRALLQCGAPVDLAPTLVEVFLGVGPEALSPYDGVAVRLERLAAMVPLGLVTDGNPVQQRAKLAATGLAPLFQVVVCTDEFGREFRKPHPRGFHAALDALGVTAERAVMIGDRPAKDVVGADAVGLRAIRVRQGEHRDAATTVQPWMEFDSICAALDHVLSSMHASV